MIIYFSTVVRSAPQQHGGEIVQLDWDRKEILARAPIAPGEPAVVDPNPRGSTRGGRGVLIDGARVLVASYHSLEIFDRGLKHQGCLSHPLFANLHELCWDGEAVWATSTDIDAAIKIDRQGRMLDVWWPREDEVTARRFHLPSLAIDKSRDNRTCFAGIGNTTPGHVHVNAAAVHDGRPVMLLNRLGCVVRLHPTEIVLHDPHLEGAHNILVTACGHLLINNTRHRSLDVFSGDGRLRDRISLDRMSPVRRILRRHTLDRLKCYLAENGRPTRVFRPLFRHAVSARPVFVRGLAATPRGTVLVGISPASILELDWKSGRLVAAFSYSTNLQVCVHGLTAVE